MEDSEKLSKVKQTIAKLLRLSQDSAATAGEAANSAEAARKLLLQYQLEAQDCIDEFTEKQKTVEDLYWLALMWFEEFGIWTSSKHPYNCHLANEIAEGLGIRMYVDPNLHALLFAGMGLEETQLGRELFHFIFAQAFSIGMERMKKQREQQAKQEEESVLRKIQWDKMLHEGSDEVISIRYAMDSFYGFGTLEDRIAQSNRHFRPDPVDPIRSYHSFMAGYFDTVISRLRRQRERDSEETTALVLHRGNEVHSIVLEAMKQSVNDSPEAQYKSESLREDRDMNAYMQGRVEGSRADLDPDKRSLS